MSVYELLATNLNRTDDKPNIELARQIIQTENTEWILELVGLLENKNKNIQSDCIKTLYEIGENGRGDLIAPQCPVFLKLLTSKNNRLIWGAMIALDAITDFEPIAVYKGLNGILQAMEKGSVITLDHGIGILAKLSANTSLSDIVFPLLIKQLILCPAKQLPKYAEKSFLAVDDINKTQFIDLLESRLSDMEKNPQRIRINRLIIKLNLQE